MSLEQLMDIYRNAPSAENLCKALKHDLQCDFILITWRINDRYWYIPVICDFLIDEKVNTSGWYIGDEPNEKNIPIRHSKLEFVTVFETFDCVNAVTNGKVIWAMTTHTLLSTTPQHSQSLPPATFILSPNYSFVLESFINKLRLTDILNRQKNRQELMLSNISHSIRTPLNGILHMTNSIITTNTATNSIITDQLNYLNQSAVALATNIFDIIDMTKLELGKLSINKEIFNLHELITSAMSLANSISRSKNVNLEYYITPNVPEYIYSDKKRIKQILINMLENSIQHTQKGEIILYVDATIINLLNEDKDHNNSLFDVPSHIMDIYNSTSQYSINFSVKDTGNGMDEQTKLNIFKPQEIINKQYGLSLRISMMLAQLLDGKLSLVYSEPAIGTCFNLNITVHEEEMPNMQSKTSSILNGKTVLLLDVTNIPNDRIELCRIFEKYHMPYVISSTYEEMIILHSGKHFNLTIVKYDDNSDLNVDINNIRSNIDTDIILGIRQNAQQDTPLKDTVDTSDKILTTASALASNTHKTSLHFDAQMEPSRNYIEYKTKFVELFNNYKKHSSFSETRILVVEDDQINRIVIEKILKQLGYTKIDIANNGIDALKLVNINKYKIILIDIRMPLMSGFELAEKIYEKYKSLSPKMLGITAQLVMDTDTKPWFKDFIYKPIDINELDKKIKELL